MGLVFDMCSVVLASVSVSLCACVCGVLRTYVIEVAHLVPTNQNAYTKHIEWDDSGAAVAHHHHHFHAYSYMILSIFNQFIYASNKKPIECGTRCVRTRSPTINRSAISNRLENKIRMLNRANAPTKSTISNVRCVGQFFIMFFTKFTISNFLKSIISIVYCCVFYHPVGAPNSLNRAYIRIFS